VFRGRECGRSRLIIASRTTPQDWVIKNAVSVAVNGTAMTAGEAAERLAACRRGVTDVELANGGPPQIFQFEFALAEAADLQAVDDALERLFAGGELSPRTIDDFIMRSHQYPSANKYLAGLSNYLYGVLAREGVSESGSIGQCGSYGYEAKYDSAVRLLGAFDRPPAEAICGVVALHYNQFDRAMAKTRSRRVAEISLRYSSMLRGESWNAANLSQLAHSSLDHALSDSVIKQILEWSALPLDGTAVEQIAELQAELDKNRPADILKLRLLAAEHYLASGDITEGSRHAEALRHSKYTDVWYTNYRARLQEVVIE
jgi:hypothetical protein